MKTYLNIIRLISCIFIALLCVSCESDVAAEKSAGTPPKAESLTVFFTGNVLGELKPCGCSGGQLGGLSRRAVIFNSVPDDKRLVIDTGSFVNSQDDQDLIKYEIILQSLKELGYDLVSLSREDINTGKSIGLFEDIGSLFNIISYQQSSDVDIPARFSRSLLLKGKPVVITIAAFNAKSTPIEQAGRLFACDPAVKHVGINILMLNHCDDAIIDFIARRMPEVDCIVRPSESDEPIVTGNPNRRPLIFSVGRFGKYVCGLQITESPDYSKPSLGFLSVPVTEELKEEDALVHLYKVYQQIVSERNLLEEYQRFSLPDDLKYTGSASCKGCHDYEYDKWSQNAHARAYSTLERVGSNRDPECVSCHVVGMKYDSGFISEQKTGHLKNVGCENCHGPGSKHVGSGGVTALTEPKSGCIDCHTPDHSGGYAGNEGAFLEKIVHWREPNTGGSVK
ncbi:MAG: cytochrome c family protein [Sedimentisphaerales bacterium]|nr:cytochrome c family protein [Sedimentisphaerales bacterium]